MEPEDLDRGPKRQVATELVAPTIADALEGLRELLRGLREFADDQERNLNLYDCRNMATDSLRAFADRIDDGLGRIQEIAEASERRKRDGGEKMTCCDLNAISRHADFIDGVIVLDRCNNRVSIDVRGKDEEYQMNACDYLAQSLGRAGYSGWDVWCEEGYIYVGPKEHPAEDALRNCDRFNTGHVEKDAQDAMEAILDEGVAGYRGIAEWLLSPVNRPS